jgi:hypothetical protein
MAYKRATYTGADDIQNAFETMYEDGYCYSVWASERDIAFQFPYADHEKGRQYFNDNIAALDQSGNDDLFTLKFHPAVKNKEFVEKKTTVICSIPFRVKSLSGDIMNGVGEPNTAAHGIGTYKMFEAIEAIKSLPAKMDERQAAFETRMLAMMEAEPEPVEQIDPIEKYVGMAIGALKEPNVMQNVAGILAMIFPGYKLPTMQQQQQPAISGTNETEIVDQQPKEVDIEKLDLALQRLAKHCELDNDLTRLADIAENNPQYFKMMLLSLRS